MPDGLGFVLLRFMLILVLAGLVFPFLVYLGAKMAALGWKRGLQAYREHTALSKRKPGSQSCDCEEFNER